MVRTWLSVVLVALGACGGSTPTRPTPAPAIVRLGPQLLLIEHHSTTAFCGIPNGAGASVIMTSVTLRWSGSEWIGTATTAASGELEMHLRPVGATTAASVSGTITGTAIHQPELLQGVPPWTARFTFPPARYGTLSGVLVAGHTSVAEITGTGTGAATVSDGAGVECPGTSFTWHMTPFRA
jgi:hypothetical protein